MTLRVWDLEDMEPEELAKISTPIEAHIAGVRRAWAEHGGPPDG